MRKETFRANDQIISADYLLAVNDTVLVSTYFDRAKTKVKSCACAFGVQPVQFGYIRYQTKKSSYHTVYKPVKTGRDRFFYAFTWNSAIDEGRFLITTEQYMIEDVYNHLMNSYHLPLLKEWTSFLLNTGISCSMIGKPRVDMECVDERRTICLHDRQISLEELIVLDFSKLSEDDLKKMVSAGLSQRRIQIASKAQNSLIFGSFDDYLCRYGKTIVENLEKELDPLVELKGNVDSLALYHKRLYPQQAACVNGIMALRKAGSRYGLLVEGMGCGKTLQGAGICDAYANEEWLRKHPGKSLVDLYKTGGVRYRNIMMAPSHLIEKWKDEILSEIPGSSVTVINDFSTLTKLRAEGKERKGREWYLVSKDYCKLGSQYSPIPINCGVKYPVVRYCLDCMEENDSFVTIPKMGKRAVCPSCQGHRFGKRELREYGTMWGMLCPECGELLLKGVVDESMDYDYAVGTPLRPRDFASRNKTNSVCGFCDAQLWGVDVKPVSGGNPEMTPPKPMWRKISHWKNYAKKTRTTAFVLRGKEWDYTSHKFCDGMKDIEREYGPRKTAPSLYIRKYLKGYFDFCILDECHKYENGGTAQSNAAHALVSVSDFTIGMTGTLTNGKADSLFYLLYMLDAGKMQKEGYLYTDVMRFVERYGSIETVFESDDVNEGSYNTCSRGRQIQSPRVKPGINPLMVTDFLLEKSVFLDLSDLSQYLPKLKEQVVLVEDDRSLSMDYNQVLAKLKETSHEKEGRGILTQILNFGLSYYDKPFGRKPIMSTSRENYVVAHIPEHPEYQDMLLPKEKKLVEIVKKELDEDRRCFVYCSYTGEAETNVTERLKAIIEKECNLNGQVYVLTSTNPAPVKRERFLKEKAAEGYRVIICNPKCVETGLDFCFWHDGKWYNYPTLIFYQISYELSVIWQASRRAYRLIQTEECRNYYLGCENTMQAAALQIMAEKQVAASAIQGKFSADGLSALAQGVDPRLRLAQMLSTGDVSSRTTLENMFDALNKSEDTDSQKSYGEWVRPKTYYELMGIVESDNIPKETTLLDILTDIGKTEVEVTQADPEQKPKPETEQGADFKEISIFDLHEFCVIVNDNVFHEMPKPRTKRKDLDGQMTLFGLIA